MFSHVNRATTPLVGLFGNTNTGYFSATFLGRYTISPTANSIFFPFHYVPVQSLTFSLVPIANTLPLVIRVEGTERSFSDVSVSLCHSSLFLLRYLSMGVILILCHISIHHQQWWRVTYYTYSKSLDSCTGEI